MAFATPQHSLLHNLRYSTMCVLHTFVGIVLKRHDQALIGVACGWLVVDELHITVLAVDPLHRGLGHGLTLLRSLLQRARQDGAVHATLEVASDNKAAINLYARCGFRSAGCREGYYRDGRDALIQWRRLDDSNGG